MSQKITYNQTIKPFNLIAFIKGFFNSKTIDRFYTVSRTSFRFGDINDIQESHFKKYQDAFNCFKEATKHYKDGKYYKDIIQTENESGIKFKVSDIGEKWDYLIELFEQELK